MRALPAVLVALACASSPALGQVSRGDPIPLSQFAAVEQAVAWTTLEVTWRGPVARGRELFGSLVPWEKTWTPSADSAAVFRTSEPILVAGEPVAAGEYALWIVPRAEAPWTVVLSRPARVFHAPYPGPEGDVIRVDLPIDSGDHAETLHFSFPRVEGRRADLTLRWGTTVLSIPIEVSEDTPRL